MKYIQTSKMKQWFLMATILCMSLKLVAQYPIRIDLIASPPYPHYIAPYANLTQNYTIKLTNTDPSSSYEMYFKGTMSNDGTTVAKSKSNFKPPTGYKLLPGQTVTVFVSQISQLDKTFKRSNMDVLINEPELLLSGRLPEGNYSICLQAINWSGDQPISDPDLGCKRNILIQYIDPPDLLPPPDDGGKIGPFTDLEQITQNFRWTPINKPPGSDMKYYYKMMDATDVNPSYYHDALNNVGSSFIVDEPALIPNTYQYSSSNPGVARLINGHTYAHQVRGYDNNGYYYIKNYGFGPTKSFIVGGASPTTGGGGITVTPVLPLTPDTFPFEFVPCLVRIEPNSNEYRRFEYTLTINNNTIGTTVHQHERTLNWPNGPWNYLKQSFPNATQDRAHLFPTTCSGSSSTCGTVQTPYTPLVKGNTYEWGLDAEITHASQGLVQESIRHQKFVHGMPRPKLLTENNIELPPGNHTLRWHSGTPPKHLSSNGFLFNIMGNPANNNSDVAVGDAWEQWRLEVSKDDPNFNSSNLIKTEQAQLGPISFNFDRDQIIDALYKNLEEDVDFQDEGDYYWRVGYTKTLSTGSDFYITSATGIIKIRNGGPGRTVPPWEPDEEDEGDCQDECLAENPTNRTAVAMNINSTYKLGKFDLLVKTVTSSSNNRFTGTGTINLPFMNSVKIKVDFKDVKVNGDGKAFEGTATAQQDNHTFTYRNDATVLGKKIFELDESQQTSFDQFLSDGERLLTAFTESSEIGMPIGIDNTLGEDRFIMGIVDMKWTTTDAKLGGIINFQVPEVGDKMPCFGVGEVCFTPSGLGENGKAYLARNWKVFDDDGHEIKLKGGGVNEDETSYVEWNCKGFKCAKLKGEVKFSRDFILPEDGNTGKVKESGNVKGTFRVDVCEGANWLAQLDMEAFQAHDMEGISFEPNEVWLDMTSYANPPDINFPTQYADSTVRDPRKANNWTGFYIKSLTVKLPANFVNDNVLNRPEFSAENLLIDGTGLTVSVNARDVLESEDGSLEGFKISIDRIYLNIVSNTFVDAGLEGKFGTPANNKEEDLFDYEGIIGLDTADVFSMSFNIKPSRDRISMDFWSVATATVYESSWVKLYWNSDDSTYVGFQFNGEFNIAESALPEELRGGIAGFKIPGVKIENFRISNGGKTDETQPTLSLSSPEKNIGGFSFKLDTIYLKSNGLGIDLVMKPKVILAGNGEDDSESSISASTTFRIKSKLGRDPDKGHVFFEIDGISLDSLAVSIKNSELTLEGSVAFYSDDLDGAGYKEGAKGSLNIILHCVGDAGIYLGAEFGVKRTDMSPTAKINESAGYFSYWYVEGVLRFGENPVQLGPLQLAAIGGGISYHMIPPDLPSGNQVRAESLAEGRSYREDYSTGISVMLMLGVNIPKEETFNADLAFQITFTNSGSVRSVAFKGQGWVMVAADPESRDKAPVMVSIDIEYQNPPGAEKWRVDGDIDVAVDIEYEPAIILRGARRKNIDYDPAQEYVAANATFMFEGHNHDESGQPLSSSPNEWYFYMGEFRPNAAGVWPERGGADDRQGGIDLNILDIIEVQIRSYLMIGHGIPTELPPVHPFVMDLLTPSGDERGTGQEAQATSGRSQRSTGSYESGQGFAFGTSIDFNASDEFAIFYYQLRLLIGMDVNFSKSSAMCNGALRGSNGWYLQGQMYAGLVGDVGIIIDLWFYEGKVSIAKMSGAMVIRGGLPNPVYFYGRASLSFSVLGGAIEGACNLTVDIGEKCSDDPISPFGDVPFINYVKPSSGDNPVSVFAGTEAGFNFPVNKILELPQDDGDILRVKVKVAKLEIRERNGRTPFDGMDPHHELDVAHDGTYATKGHANKTLEGRTDYVAYVEVYATKHDATGKSLGIVKKNNIEWRESRSERFRTDKKPETLVDENVWGTWPLPDQRYFLQDESGYGWVDLLGEQAYIFEDRPDDIVVRFSPLDGGEPIEAGKARYRVGGGGSRGHFVTFRIPTLENEKTYVLQFVRKAPSATASSGSGGNDWKFNNDDPLGGGTWHGDYNTDQNRLTLINQYTGNAGFANLKMVEFRRTPGQLSTGEFKLYESYFRTSKFNKLTEKMANVSFPNRTMSNFELAFGTFAATSTLDEPLERYDVRGYWKNGSRVMHPLIKRAKIDHISEYISYNDKVKRNLYDPVKAIRATTVTRQGTRGIDTYDLSDDMRPSFRDKGKNFKYCVNISSSMMMEPLGDYEKQPTTGTGSSGGSSGGLWILPIYLPSPELNLTYSEMYHAYQYAITAKSNANEMQRENLMMMTLTEKNRTIANKIDDLASFDLSKLNYIPGLYKVGFQHRIKRPNGSHKHGSVIQKDIRFN